jgi:hypothetical protein
MRGETQDTQNHVKSLCVFFALFVPFSGYSLFLLPLRLRVRFSVFSVVAVLATMAAPGDLRESLRLR